MKCLDKLVSRPRVSSSGGTGSSGVLACGEVMVRPSHHDVSWLDLWLAITWRACTQPFPRWTTNAKFKHIAMTLYISRDYQTDLLQRFEQRDKREHVFTPFIDAREYFANWTTWQWKAWETHGQLLAIFFVIFLDARYLILIPIYWLHSSAPGIALFADNKLVQGNIALIQQNEAIENTARAMKEENDRLNREISLAREQGCVLF